MVFGKCRERRIYDRPAGLVRDLPAELGATLLESRLQFCRAAIDGKYLLGQGRTVFREKRPLLVRHLIGRYSFALLVRGNDNRPLLVLQDVQALCLRRFLHGFHLGIQLVLGSLALRLHLGLKRFPPEGCPQRLGQPADQLPHCVAQLSAFARRQTNRDGFSRRAEIVQVDPVVRCPAVADGLVQKFDRRRQAPTPVLAQNEYVKARLRHRKGHFQRFAGALMAGQVEDRAILARTGCESGNADLVRT